MIGRQDTALQVNPIGVQVVPGPWLRTNKAYHFLRRFHLTTTTFRYACGAGFGFAQSYLNSAVVIFMGINPKNLDGYLKHVISFVTGGTTLAYAAYVYGNLRNPSPSEVAETSSTAPVAAQRETGTEDMAQIYDVLDLIRMCQERENWLKYARKSLMIRQVLAGIHPVFDSTFTSGTIADYAVFINKDWLDSQPRIQSGFYIGMVFISTLSYISRVLLVRSMRLRYPVIPDEQLRSYPGLPWGRVAKNRLIAPAVLSGIGGLALGVYWSAFILNRSSIGPEDNLYNGVMWGGGIILALVYGFGGALAEINYQLQIDPILRDYRIVYERIERHQPDLLIGLPLPPEENILACFNFILPNTRNFWLGMLWGLASAIFEAMAMNNIYRAANHLGSDDNPPMDERIWLSVFILIAVSLGLWNHYGIQTRDYYVQSYREGLIEVKKRLLHITAAPPERREEAIEAVVGAAQQAEAAAINPEAAAETKAAAELEVAAATVTASQGSSAELAIAASLEPLLDVVVSETASSASSSGVYRVAGAGIEMLASPNAYTLLSEVSESEASL